MEYGMNMLLWTDHVTERHKPVLSDLKAMGYDDVEFPIFEIDPDHYGRMGKVLDEIGLKRSVVTGRGAEDNPISTDPAIRRAGVDANKRCVDCCVALGVTEMTGPFHSVFGHFTGEGPTEDEWKWGVEGMQEAADYAAGQGVHLSLEFLNRFECYLLNTCADTARFVADVDRPNVGVLYDTHHANIEEDDVGKAIRDHGARISHIHISENNRGTPGRGQVNWNDSFDAIHDIGYDGLMVVEAFGLAAKALIPVVKVWRRCYESEDQLAREALAFMKREVARRRAD